MERSHAFFWIFVGTLLATRVFLYITHLEGPTIAGFRVHHYVYGLVGAACALVIKSPALLSVSLALFADEVPMLLGQFKTYEEYLAVPSLAGALSFAVPVFFLKETLVKLASRKQKTAPL